jgi:hypothetical protein
MERAANKVPLPSRLRSKLRIISETTPRAAVDDAPRMPMPQAQMPGPLRDRLRQMGRRQAPPPLPAWVRSSRYAVAASYLLAVLLGATIGNPARLGRETAGALSRSMDRAIETVEDRGRRRLGDLGSAVRERYGATRNSLEQTLESLEHKATELDEMRKSLFSLDLLTDWNEGD